MSGPVFTGPDEPAEPGPVDHAAARARRAGAHAGALAARELAGALAVAGLSLRDLREDSHGR